jgi:hypothetical protein
MDQAKRAKLEATVRVTVSEVMKISVTTISSETLVVRELGASFEQLGEIAKRLSVKLNIPNPPSAADIEKEFDGNQVALEALSIKSMVDSSEKYLDEHPDIQF